MAKKVKLTKYMLEVANPHTSIHKGFGVVRNHWNSEVKQKIKFVIFRGGIVDWCVYYTTELDNSWEDIENYGEKLHSEIDLKMIVDYDEETYKLYRH